MTIVKKISQAYSEIPRRIKATMWFFICSFLQKGISVITTPIFTRLLSTSEYGKFSVFSSWMNILAVFVTLRLDYGVYAQGLVKFEDERDVFSSSLQGLTLTLVAGWTVIYLLFRNFWNELFSLTTVQMLALLLMIWTSAVFSFWTVEQRVKLNYVKLVIITVLVSIAKPVVGIIFIINAEDKVTARILGLALVELFAYSIFFVVQMKHGKKFFSRKFWKYVLLFNIPLVPHYLSQTVLNSSDRIMINNMVGEDASGIYSLAYSISMIMLIFNHAFSQTISPWFFQKIKDRKVEDTKSVVYISLSLIAVVNLLLIAFAPEIIAMFAPKSYQEAIWVVPPVTMSVYFVFMYDLFSNIEFYYEKTKFIMFASILAAILNVVLNYIFIRIFGYYAAGYTTLVCYIVYALAHYLFMRRICKTYMNKKTIYNSKILSVISIVFVLISFTFLATYKLTIIRYFIALTLIVITACNYKKILNIIKILMVGRRQNKT